MMPGEYVLIVAALIGAAVLVLWHGRSLTQPTTAPAIMPERYEVITSRGAVIFFTDSQNEADLAARWHGAQVHDTWEDMQ